MLLKNVFPFLVKLNHSKVTLNHQKLQLRTKLMLLFIIVATM